MKKVTDTEQIVQSLDKLSLLMRALLWEQAKEHDVSAVQLQVLMLLAKDAETEWTLTLLTKHFLLTKATVSQTIKSLEQKQLINKKLKDGDARSYNLILTERGKRIAHVTEHYLNPVAKIVARVPAAEQAILLKNINGIISKLQTY